METRKIAIACFIGGAICTAIALMVEPLFWWLGLLAGFAAGYISYEFKEVPKAIPRAWHATKQEIIDLFLGLAKYWKKFREWNSKEQPHFYFTLICVSLPAMLLLHIILYVGFDIHYNNNVSFDLKFVSCLFILMLTYLVLYAKIIILLIKLVELLINKGSMKKLDVDVYHRRRELFELNECITPDIINYNNLLHWLGIGLMQTARVYIWWIIAVPVAFCLAILKIALFIVWTLPKFCAKYAWVFFKLIHSDKRLLCGIDSAIGGAMAYLLLSGQITTAPSRILIIAFGGMIGAALGAINYELIAKRWLKPHLQAKT